MAEVDVHLEPATLVVDSDVSRVVVVNQRVCTFHMNIIVATEVTSYTTLNNIPDSTPGMRVVLNCRSYCHEQRGTVLFTSS